MAVEELNKVKYVDQDFNTSVDSIKNFLQTNYPEEYSDYVASNLGQALIDILAYAVQNLMWNLNRKVTDFYFPTARTPNAISKISRMLGYKPKGATGSIVNVTVRLSGGPYLFPVPLSKGFQFKGPNGLIFEYRGSVPILWSPSELTKTFEVREGQTKIANFVSNGETNQSFKLLNVPTGKYVEQGTVEVRVNNELWTEYDFVPFDTVKGYETNLLSSPPFIKFGDGVQGVVPPDGASVQVKYIVVSGFNGRIVSNVITEPVSALVAQLNTIPMTITQPGASIGGDNPEDLRSITVNAPRFQRTQDRAITKSDYDFLSNQFPNVARADAQIIRGVSGDIFINSVYAGISSITAAEDNLIKTISGFSLNPSSVASVSGKIDTASGFLPNLQNMANNISSLTAAETSSIISNAALALNDILTLADDPSVSGVAVTVSGYLNDINSAVANIQTINSSASGLPVVSGSIISISGSLESTKSDLSQIIQNSKDTATLYAVTGYSIDIFEELVSLSGYLDENMTDGCRANTVQVAVLSKDSARKYVEPASSTITDLKSYLAARKDAVHTLSIISGTARVLNADLLVEIKMSDQADEDDVISRVSDCLIKSDAVPFGLLVDRAFNESLYLSDIYDAIDVVVEDFETEYINVIIQNPSGYINARGNLIAPLGYVIQAGTLTINKL